jgi:hypothetical protein
MPSQRVPLGRGSARTTALRRHRPVAAYRTQPANFPGDAPRAGNGPVWKALTPGGDRRFAVSKPNAFALALAAVLVGSAGPAGAAGSCLDQVRDLASQHGTPSKPPTATPGDKDKGGGGVTTQDLARSGGVIAPPPMDDKSVIKPPANTHDAMPTVPDVATKQAPAGEAPEAQLTQLQAALTAARAQAERGDEKGCEEALARARTLAERTQ